MRQTLRGRKSDWRRLVSAVTLLAVVALSAPGCGDAPKPAATPSTTEPVGATTKATSPAAKKKQQSSMTAQEKRALRKKESGG
jgi:hypothetical protein